MNKSQVYLKPQMLSPSKKITVIFSLLLISLGSTPVAQKRNISEGVYTQAQAILGKDDHDANCKACHSMKFYRDIWFAWEERPLMNFWYILVSEMPSDNPGSLSDDEYTNIVAYILSDLGFPAGDVPLDPSNEMEGITIAPF